MKIQIHIDSLRLEGVEPMTGEELSAMIEQELHRLIEIWGVPPALRDGGALQLDSRTIQVEPGSTRGQVGAQIARQLAGNWFGAI